MPDFDFDAFNHEYEMEGSEENVEAATATQPTTEAPAETASTEETPAAE